MDRIAPDNVFHTTRWSIVVQAKEGDDDARKVCKEELARRYSAPMRAFLRRAGLNEHDAWDCTQDLLVDLASGELLKTLRPREHRFRDYIRAALRNAVKDIIRKKRAQKRGGDAMIASLENLRENAGDHLEPASVDSPDRAFVRKETHELFEIVKEKLALEFEPEWLAMFYARRLVHAPQPWKKVAELASEASMPADTARYRVGRVAERFSELFLQEVSADAMDLEDTRSVVCEMIEAFRQSRGRVLPRR